jgi:putative nucleotidyltransferase with HDIG domain
MKQSDLELFKDWFAGYCKSFHSADKESQKNILLKEEHTLRVCENAVLISRGVGIDRNASLLAETAALFHDIGRFRQYREYRTFRDSISVNHGLLGATILREEKVLDRLPSDEQDLILKTVSYHNAFSIPRIDDERTIYVLKLVRDADKLDIWRVFLEHYDSPEGERASGVDLGLPDVPVYSEKILSLVLEKRIPSFPALKTLNDFKLMQLSWIYDLNFLPSFRLVHERGYIPGIVKTMPKTAGVARVSHFLEEYALQRLGGGQTDSSS